MLTNQAKAALGNGESGYVRKVRRDLMLADGKTIRES